MPTSAFALAVASYLSLHPAFMLPPIGLLCYDRLCQQEAASTGNPAGRKTDGRVAIDQRALPSAAAFGIQLTIIFLAAFGLLLGLSFTLLPSLNFVSSVYLTPLQLPDLTPNPGLWWYFFIEMFDAFRSFFLGVFWLHMLSYCVPLSIRLRKQPLAAVVLMMGIIAIFEPYANIGDVGAWISCLCLLGHVFERTSLTATSLLFQPADRLALVSSSYRYTFPALAALLYCMLLGPAFHHLWIYAGSGNANFFYAITLVWNLALLIILTDTLFAVLRDEWEVERPEGVGKEVRQM